MTTDEYARFYKALADYYHVDRDRAEKCLSDIVDIMSNSEPDWVKSILERLREHYTR